MRQPRGVDATSEKDACRVYGIDTFPTLVAFPLHPMPIEIRKKAINIIGTRGVAVPFLSIVPQQCFVLERVRLLEALRSTDLKQEWRGC